MKIADDVLNVLDRAETDGNALRLTGQLDRKLYEQTNKVLAAAGGKWTRHAKAHLFPSDAADAIENIILTGEITTQQEYGYFPTPPDVVHQMLDLAELQPGMTVLEPSAGRGAIAGPVAALGCCVDCVELQTGNTQALSEAGYARRLVAGDFLHLDPFSGLFDEAGYDRVVMNPPFARQQDISHVTHALTFLRPGGLLVAVMSNGVTFRQNQATADFRTLVHLSGGRIVPLPDNAFATSGTDVRTVLAVIPATA